jgi:uncharacterized protein (DUF305 family)
MLLAILPIAAFAQTTAPMPMHNSAMTNCPMMSNMMQSAHGPADQMMMGGMMKMHQGMGSMHLTGDADKDFLAMMIPHHEGAIAMAKAELQYGKDPRAIALAKQIIASQQKEIDDMRGWLK